MVFVYVHEYFELSQLLQAHALALHHLVGKSASIRLSYALNLE